MRRLFNAGIVLDVHGIGQVGRGAGEIILAILAQVADMERQRIAERTAVGRAAARTSLATTGLTHRGKTSLGRPKANDAVAVVAWRVANSASIAETAQKFGLSTATTKRYCAATSTATA